MPTVRKPATLLTDTVLHQSQSM